MIDLGESTWCFFQLVHFVRILQDVPIQPTQAKCGERWPLDTLWIEKCLLDTITSSYTQTGFSITNYSQRCELWEKLCLFILRPYKGPFKIAVQFVTACKRFMSRIHLRATRPGSYPSKIMLLLQFYNIWVYLLGFLRALCYWVTSLMQYWPHTYVSTYSALIHPLTEKSV